jgi:serine/threonine protein phosphatase 1
MRRTFVVGDIHGDLDGLVTVMDKLPPLTEDDTIVFLGDYLDRGPRSKEVVDFVRALPNHTKARIVPLRGNHEDAWLRVVTGGWPEFVAPVSNGCVATLRSFVGKAHVEGEMPTQGEIEQMWHGLFFPEDVVAWMMSLPYFHEDEHGIYVHAGLVEDDDGFMHPSKVAVPAQMLWVRTMHFFTDYEGKTVVVGHTSTDYLPPELSRFTPEDPEDTWASENVFAIDTGAGKGGFLTCLELPAKRVYESR